MKRKDQKVEDCWAIEDLYESDEAFEQDFHQLEEKISKLSSFRGRVADSGEGLFSYLEEDMRLSQMAERLYVYACQKSHEDTANATYQKLSNQARTLLVNKEAATAFFAPEILKLSNEQMESLYSQWKPLEKYRIYLDEIFRQKQHTLSVEEEKLLADVTEVTQSSSDIFSMFNNADVHFIPAKDSEGKEWSLTHGTYISLLESKDQTLRKNAFANLYDQYQKYSNTLAAVFRANVKQYVFYSRSRKYPDSLSYGLDKSNIPVNVYHQLISTVHAYLPLMYRYVLLRKKRLELSELHMYDIYVPMVSDVQEKISFEEAKRVVLNGLQPMGQEYVSLLEKAFQNRWIDVYENEGKRSGAYSWGAYGIHPYVLLNYQDNLNSVFTLAHEMGHALHSYYSDHNQDYVYAGYKIFVAEVASTCNESLLIHYLLKNSKSKKEREYLINDFMEKFRGTLFRQVMFAEFELTMHRMAQEGKVLTTEVICDTYYELNKLYFGPDVVVDKEIAMEWARIPHFYTPFYVYQYATGFSAAISISRKILAGDEKVKKGYKKFLCSGSSKDPISLLKLAGVDMQSKEPVEEAMRLFEELLNELETSN